MCTPSSALTQKLDVLKKECKLIINCNENNLIISFADIFMGHQQILVHKLIPGPANCLSHISPAQKNSSVVPMRLIAANFFSLCAQTSPISFARRLNFLSWLDFWTRCMIMKSYYLSLCFLHLFSPRNVNLNHVMPVAVWLLSLYIKMLKCVWNAKRDKSVQK